MRYRCLALSAASTLNIIEFPVCATQSGSLGTRSHSLLIHMVTFLSVRNRAPSTNGSNLFLIHI